MDVNNNSSEIENKASNTEEIKAKVAIASDSLTLFERVLGIVKNNSFHTIFKAIFFIFLIYCMIDPMWVIDRYEEIKSKRHAIELSERFDQSTNVSNELCRLVKVMGANRAFFIEYHNSVKSLEGAPFAYGNMSFEEIDDRSDYISDEYSDFMLTKYKAIKYLYDKWYFIGPLDNLEEVDRRFYLKLSSDNIKYIAMVQVEGVDQPIGCLGVTWSDDFDCNNMNVEGIKKELRTSSLKIALMLSDPKHRDKLQRKNK